MELDKMLFYFYCYEEKENDKTELKIEHGYFEIIRMPSVQWWHGYYAPPSTIDIKPKKTRVFGYNTHYPDNGEWYIYIDKLDKILTKGNEMSLFSYDRAHACALLVEYFEQKQKLYEDAIRKLYHPTKFRTMIEMLPITY